VAWKLKLAAPGVIVQQSWSAVVADHWRRSGGGRDGNEDDHRARRRSV